ncbi:RAVE subunit 2/Rogdi [Coniochaeta sp. 2T2.1]|nr:RAVE subunit 2/Rogdi [Coniochaeta sp. 2T2.1]
MSVEIWPPIAPEQLKTAQETTLSRELDWLLSELHEILVSLKHGLEDCYALLAPIDPGSTLVLSTPRNEVVKGTITRVGTRIVKGTIHLRLRTLPPQTLTLDPAHAIHLAPLTNLHNLLNHSLDLLSLTLSYCYAPSPPSPPIPSPAFLSAQLRLLSQSLSDASSILKGPPLTSSDPGWTTCSVSPSHFSPPLPLSQTGVPPLSFHLGLQEGSIVLWLRSLEDANLPPTFGSKLAFAIGTARRLDHDEAERVFGFCCEGEGHGHEHGERPGTSSSSGGGGGGGASGSLRRVGSNTTVGGGKGGREMDVFVREKVRVESADPSLLSLAAKLTALGHVLGLARRNLAAVMGEELED